LRWSEGGGEIAGRGGEREDMRRGEGVAANIRARGYYLLRCARRELIPRGGNIFCVNSSLMCLLYVLTSKYYNF
jgi:hypothetical protein